MDQAPEFINPSDTLDQKIIDREEKFPNTSTGQFLHEIAQKPGQRIRLEIDSSDYGDGLRIQNGDGKRFGMLTRNMQIPRKHEHDDIKRQVKVSTFNAGYLKNPYDRNTDVNVEFFNHIKKSSTATLPVDIITIQDIPGNIDAFNHIKNESNYDFIYVPHKVFYNGASLTSGEAILINRNTLPGLVLEDIVLVPHFHHPDPKQKGQLPYWNYTGKNQSDDYQVRFTAITKFNNGNQNIFIMTSHKSHVATEGMRERNLEEEMRAMEELNPGLLDLIISTEDGNEYGVDTYNPFMGSKGAQIRLMKAAAIGIFVGGINTPNVKEVTQLAKYAALRDEPWKIGNIIEGEDNLYSTHTEKKLGYELGYAIDKAKTISRLNDVELVRTEKIPFTDHYSSEYVFFNRVLALKDSHNNEDYLASIERVRKANNVITKSLMKTTGEVLNDQK